MLFNIFLADLFFILSDVDIARYVDDNTPHITADDINDVIASSEKTSKAFFKWFENNLLKSNTDKCHLLLSSSNTVSRKDMVRKPFTETSIPYYFDHVINLNENQ